MTNEKNAAQRLARLIALYDRQARRNAERARCRKRSPKTFEPRLWADFTAGRRGKVTPAEDGKTLLMLMAGSVVSCRPSCARSMTHVLAHEVTCLDDQWTKTLRPPTPADEAACRAYDRTKRLLTRLVDAGMRRTAKDASHAA